MSRCKAGWRRQPTTARVWSDASRLCATRKSVLNGPAPIRSPSSRIVFDARFLEPTSQFILDGFTARGPTVDVAVKAETAPDGEGASLKLNIDAGPSATADLIRLWPQFINPDVRQWCAENLHGGRLQGSLKANWTAADLDAMAHKRGLPRESLHGEFTTRDVGVDLMPGLPIMMTDEGTGSFTGHEFTVSGNHATMALSPSRRVQANDLAFTVPDITPRAIVDASSKAHMTGTADLLADLLMREPLRRQAGLTLDPSTVKGQAEGDLVLALKLGQDRAPRGHKVPRWRGARQSPDREVSRRRKARIGDGHVRGRSGFAEDRGRRPGPWHADPCGGRARSRRGRVGDHNFRSRRRRTRQARHQFRLVADRVDPHQAQGAADARQCGGRNRPYAGRRRQSRPGALEAGGKAGQGDVPRQAQSGRRFAQQHRHRPWRADVPGIGSNGFRRRRGRAPR